jgi:hypothetical protein
MCGEINNCPSVTVTAIIIIITRKGVFNFVLKKARAPRLRGPGAIAPALLNRSLNVMNLKTTSRVSKQMYEYKCPVRKLPCSSLLE